ncbi:acyl carrier protein [Pleurocapsales cyanobacterium LEGE 06147]|nr:acyl carrier protein [Pleurocapsales cyanobacterium LEGE 06147]
MVSVSNQLDPKKHAPQEHLTAAKIQSWIVSYLADLLEVDSDEINVAIPFDRYGLDSSVAVGMTGDLEDWLGKELDPTLLYDYPTIEVLAQHLAEEFSVKG